jgi:carbonic anhydrase
MGELLRRVNVYQRRNLKFDFVSAIVIFLIAIPLCLGIALASGAPLFSGLLAGIIGGVVVGSLSESQVSVSGPAAGLVLIVINSVTQLGSFQIFLLAVFIAGLMQIIAGLLRIGFIVEYVPSNVIQGLLSAIGILLIVKQLPLALTHAGDFKELTHQLYDTTSSFTIAPLLHVFAHVNTGALTITLLSLVILIYFDKTKNETIKVIPAPIIVVIFGIVLNELSSYFQWYLTQDSPNLVNIPLSKGLKGFVAQLDYPTWQAWLNPKVYLYALLIASVASVESLLNLKAAEKVDKKKRRCSKDRELIAQGVGNSLAGLLGALPVTSVVVRTSVNVQSGAKTKGSAIIHGVLILIAVMMLPAVLNKIPLASLAAILLHVGYKLTSPSIYREMYHQGWDRFISFIVTLVSIVTFNILTGISVGLVVSFFFILKRNSQERLDIIKEIYPHGEISRIVLPQYATFLNKASLLAELDSIDKDSQLILDARYCTYVDKEIMELIHEFKLMQASNKNIQTNLLGFKDHYEIHDHIDFINVTTYDTQAALTPRQVLALLQEGNQRFLDENRIHRTLKTDIKHTSTTQHPIAVVLGCIDSRVPIETIFDAGFGDLFCVRVAGNIINDDVLASMEYATSAAGAKLIVVLGHIHCGAIKAACQTFEGGLITQLLEKVKPAIAATPKVSQSESDYVTAVAHANIANSLSQVMTKSPLLAQLIETKQVGIAGAIYDIESGNVMFKDYSDTMQKINPDLKNVDLIY